MTLTLTLDPDSPNNGLMVSYLTTMLMSMNDLQVVVEGDTYGDGTWRLSFGDPLAVEGDDAWGSLNMPGGWPNYTWNVVNHVS